MYPIPKPGRPLYDGHLDSLKPLEFEDFLYHPGLSTVKNHNVSETGSVSECYLSSYLDFRMMDNVNKVTDYECHRISPEPF
jgi:hypothetical protein